MCQVASTATMVLLWLYIELNEFCFAQLVSIHDGPIQQLILSVPPSQVVSIKRLMKSLLQV